MTYFLCTSDDYVGFSTSISFLIEKIKYLRRVKGHQFSLILIRILVATVEVQAFVGTDTGTVK